MPAQYVAIRDSLVKKGMSLKSAKTHAARIYNAERNKKPSLPKLSNKRGAK